MVFTNDHYLIKKIQAKKIEEKKNKFESALYGHSQLIGRASDTG